MSITGFAALPNGSSKLGTFTIPGTAVKLVLRKDVAPILINFAADFHRLVESLILKKCGGHNYRYIAGTTTWSRHARGIAIDLNWSRHPQGANNTFSAADEKVIHNLLKKYSYKGTPLIRWGGDYTGKKDEMHFELNQSLTSCLAAVKLLQAPRPIGTYRLGARTLKLASPLMRGNDVLFIQRFIGSRQAGKADGIFGADTKRGVQWYQQMRGIQDDGIVGDQTWRQMGY